MSEKKYQSKIYRRHNKSKQSRKESALLKNNIKNFWDLLMNPLLFSKVIFLIPLRYEQPEKQNSKKNEKEYQANILKVIKE